MSDLLQQIKAKAVTIPEHRGQLMVPLSDLEKILEGMVATRPDKYEQSKRVEWIVNDIAELGVKVDGVCYFLYKGYSLIYEDAKHDDGSPMHYRPVFKREFGECCHPINYADPTRIGTVSLDDDDEWQELPPYPPLPQPTLAPDGDGGVS